MSSSMNEVHLSHSNDVERSETSIVDENIVSKARHYNEIQVGNQQGCPG